MPKSHKKSSSVPSALPAQDRKAGIPRWRSLVALIREQIGSGALQPGDRLPSTRRWAQDLGVARGTVLSAVDLLCAEGLLECRRGSGTFVSRAAESHAISVRPDRKLPHRVLRVKPDVDPAVECRIDFQPCRPSLEAFPTTPWRRAFAAAAEFTFSPDYGDPRGERRLREAIGHYLRRARSLSVPPDEIMITNGTIHAVHLLTRMFVSPGQSVVMENPGYPLARQAFEINGASVVPLAIDDDGVQIESLPKDGGGHRLIYLTPAHQFPTGSRLSLGRRKQLLEWAQRNDILVLEDDYDGEFRYDVPPLPPLAAMAPGGPVIYLGTFSKTLFPALRLGYVCGPRQLIDELAQFRNALDYQSPAIPQIALARFMEDGDFERHIMRMRRIYSRKRAALADALHACKFPGRLLGIDSGINGRIRLQDGADAKQIARTSLAQHGIHVPPLSRYLIPGTQSDEALVVGFGSVSESEIARGVQQLSEIASTRNPGQS